MTKKIKDEVGKDDAMSFDDIMRHVLNVPPERPLQPPEEIAPAIPTTRRTRQKRRPKLHR